MPPHVRTSCRRHCGRLRTVNATRAGRFVSRTALYRAREGGLSEWAAGRSAVDALGLGVHPGVGGGVVETLLTGPLTPGRRDEPRPDEPADRREDAEDDDVLEPLHHVLDLLPAILL